MNMLKSLEELNLHKQMLFARFSTYVTGKLLSLPAKIYNSVKDWFNA